MSEIANKIDSVDLALQKLSIKKDILIKKAMSSTSPNDILRAQKSLENIEQRQNVEKKSYIIDPLDFDSSFGYKDKPFSMSYHMLRGMAKTPIINSIIKTRKNQIADFAEPQADKYSTGFIVKKKTKSGQKSLKLNDEETKTIEYITDFLLNCGVNNSWDNDDFETFIRKIVEDSLVLDQMTFEVVRDKSGKPFQFFAADAATFRIADSFVDEEYGTKTREQVKGYYPNYVQVLNDQIKAEFYPWELCFGVRNPSTSVHNVGYGMSELEELVTTITSMLWAEEYNRKFFSQGSAPKGLLRVKGQVNEKELSAFRQQWNSMITGVANSWKTPIIDADIDWIDLQKNNRDMEYNSWMEFLIKISCAIYSIDPNEIGFSINSGSSSNVTFESNNEGRLKHSKDKGLYPMLKFIQRQINKHIVSQINPDYEMLFVGLNGMTIQEELDIEIKKLSNFQTVNETRTKFDMEEIEGGDTILSPTFTQAKAMAAQQAQQSQQSEEFNPFDMSDEEDDDENPFMKAFKNNIEK